MAVVVPETLISTDIWKETGKPTGPTFSRPMWVENQNGETAIRKPGRSFPNGLEAAREVVASQLGRWLDVSITTVELLATHPDGPCCISRAISGSVLPFNQALAPFAPAALQQAALAALPQFCGAIVLDALLGNCDRFNIGNIVYAETQGRWYTLDYSLAFNIYSPGGVGNRAEPFGVNPALRQTYFAPVLEALRLNPSAFQTTLTLAENISNEEIERLFALVPPSHGSVADIGQMCGFVKFRRSQIRVILATWCNSVSLHGII